MKKNKFFAFLLAGCMLLTGCSGEGGDEETAETTTDGDIIVTVTDENGEVVTDEEGEAVTSIIPAKPAEKELKVGFIYPMNAGGDALSDIFEAARLEAMRVLGAKTYYVENVLVSQFEAATAALVHQGCNVIVSTSAKFANAVYDEAKANGKVSFISFGGTKSMSNLVCYQGEMYKAAYLCGLAAAYNSSSNTLGVLADPSVLNVYNVIDGFVQGAKDITEKNTDVRVNWAWDQNDSDVMDAINNLRSQGCDVIYTASYSKFAAKYCESLGIKVIGMASDLPELAPTQYITGGYYNLDMFLIDALREVRYETSGLGVYYAGIKEGTIRLVQLGQACKTDTEKIFDASYELCNDGMIAFFRGEIKDTDGTIQIAKGVTLDDSKIAAVNWLDECVRAENNYCTPNLSPVESDLFVFAGQTEHTEEDGEDTEDAANTPEPALDPAA